MRPKQITGAKVAGACRDRIGLFLWDGLAHIALCVRWITGCSCSLRIS